MKIKRFIVSILFPILLGSVIGLFIQNGIETYRMLEKPFFAPPKIVFPIAWTILYFLMGVSFYRILDKKGNERAKKYYFLQLFVNLLWPIFFFVFQFRLFSFFWLLLLIFLVLKMIFLFYQKDSCSAYLQIPYLLWLIFAALLNFSVFYLNL